MHRVNSGWTWAGAAGGAGMVLGAFGPWIRAPLGNTVNGLDGATDGWVILATAVLAGLALFLRDQRGKRSWAALSMLAGLGASATALYDRTQVDRLTSGSFDVVQVGWGLNLALIASIVLVVASIPLLGTSGDSSPRKGEAGPADPPPPISVPVVQPAATPLAAAGWYPDPHGVADLRYWSGTDWTDQVTQALEPGWYADPQREAELRWWTGREWTTHVSGPPASGVAAPVRPSS